MAFVCRCALKPLFIHLFQMTMKGVLWILALFAVMISRASPSKRMYKFKTQGKLYKTNTV